MCVCIYIYIYIYAGRKINNEGLLGASKNGCL